MYICTYIYDDFFENAGPPGALFSTDRWSISIQFDYGSACFRFRGSDPSCHALLNTNLLNNLVLEVYQTALAQKLDSIAPSDGDGHHNHLQ